MRRTKLLLSALLVAGAATGCTRANTLALAPLDQPATVTATGPQCQGEVTVYRTGVLDPTGSLSTIAVRDTALQVTTSAERASVDELTIKLADADLAPTAAMPSGVHLRNQTLTLPRAVDAAMVQREPNALDVRMHTSLVYRAAIVLDDGSLYTLGATQTQAGDIDVRATRYEFGVHVTVDAAPQGQCWSIPGVIDVSDCSLYIETDGDASAR